MSENGLMDGRLAAWKTVVAEQAARVAELEKARGWQPIDETTPKDVSIIVAVMNTYSQTWTVGEAYWNDTDNDWWWANVSSGDYTGDSILNMNGPVEFWQPMPVAPVARTTLGRPKMEGIETMKSPKDERITVETWAFLDMLAAEIRRVAGDKEETVDLAERVQGIATVLKEQASK